MDFIRLRRAACERGLAFDRGDHVGDEILGAVVAVVG
jgi:hypothetical protein